jgi:hypothetical protein
MADDDYDSIIATAVLAAAGAGPTIVVPLLDPVTMSTIWTTMTVRICQRAGHAVDRAAAGRLALAVMAGTGAYWTGSKLLGSLLSKIPFTIGPTIAANSILNALFTLRLGNALIDLMEKHDFDPKDWAYTIEFLVGTMRPRPTAAEVKRVARLSRRLHERISD